jgi:mannan endo-1,4-beta-mannosidase
MTAPSPESPALPQRARKSRRGIRVAVIGGCAIVVAAVVTVAVQRVTAPIVPAGPAVAGVPPIGTFSHHHVVITLPHQSQSYLGAFAKGVPASYSPIESFGDSTGVPQNVALYYSGWDEKFQSAFATKAKSKGAIPFIQIDPTGINLESIVAGKYDTYLESFATAVASYGENTGQGVIIGFGHEMNGDWFPWGYRHVSPALFVAAWRHVVNVFRQQGADDVTWLWTVNIISKRTGIPSPAAWWPGRSYVTWVGIDGYYLKSSWTFASLFGPTIKVVRELTFDPILISETGALANGGQPGEIANLFAGVHAYGLLGFVWFDAVHGTDDWRLEGPAADAAYSRGAKSFHLQA